MLEIVLDRVDETDAVLDTLEHALVDLDPLGELELVRIGLIDLVFNGDALADLAAVVLREMRGDEEGVVVCDSDAEILGVALVQMLDVVL